VWVIGLVADDLTGASDTAVQFARHGWTTLLVLTSTVRLAPDTTYDQRDSVLAITTDCRPLDNSTAEKVTADAVSRLIAADADRIFLKVDSTMRGSVPGQIAGALAAWQMKYPTASAVVCPAYPRMGRTVVANQLLVNGQPVDQSSIGRDPVTPVRTSDLAVLLPGSLNLRVQHLEHRAGAIVTVDAPSEAELGTIASAIASLGPSILPVGSAGLAAALAAVWSPAERSVRRKPDSGADLHLPKNPRIFILVTSLNPVSHAQVARLAGAFPDVDLLVAPTERVGNTSVAERLATDFADRIAREKYDVLGFVGGDGARAALHRLGASAIQIADAILEGIPFGQIVGGRADGLPIFTKAGGFGGEDALIRVVQSLKT
jgi:D-threonate/D-erythronate kinase